MSLKAFHIMFITISGLLFAFLAVVSFFFMEESFSKTLGIVGVVGFVLILGYGVYFLRKTRSLHNDE